MSYPFPTSGYSPNKVRWVFGVPTATGNFTFEVSTVDVSTLSGMSGTVAEDIVDAIETALASLAATLEGLPDVGGVHGSVSASREIMGYEFSNVYP